MEDSESSVKISCLRGSDEINPGLVDSDSFVNLNEDEKVIELNFKEGPPTPYLQDKADEIEKNMKTGITIAMWKDFALSPGGLVNDRIRKQGWPILLGLNPNACEEMIPEENLREHPEYSQVVLDVNRSLKRFPPGIPIEQRLALQDQLTNLILRVITKYPHLRYYQGYHDVAITFLLVVGEELALRIMETLSTNHLRDCMEPTMEKTSLLLNYIFPLLKRLNPDLFSHLERSGAGTMFCLPWFLTWFGHSLNHYKDVVRLYDAFLATAPLVPLYLTAVIVNYRASELLQLEPDMATVHCFLSQLPDDLPFDRLVSESVELFAKFPPESIEAEVKERTRLEKEAQQKEEEKARKRRRGAIKRGGSSLKAQLERIVPSSRAQLLLLAFSIAIGFYAYLRGNGGPPAIR
ncbi:TBC1 domain family member 20 [Halyomorpha halys]|uniref:TBC1 domain family member 20 n=1 Tax=Halyomorpha halys TaxID=286706 RepID=UPI0006D4E0CE|nr:TBC1 domain family member 20 isoform X1 [Halyomorpha halys]